MYCGCNEKALTSQRAIACALLRLMEAGPYADISISQLCREAGVSRPPSRGRRESGVGAPG